MCDKCKAYLQGYFFAIELLIKKDTTKGRKQAMYLAGKALLFERSQCIPAVHPTFNSVIYQYPAGPYLWKKTKNGQWLNQQTGELKGRNSSN